MRKKLSKHPIAVYQRKYRKTHPRKDKRDKEAQRQSSAKFRAAHPIESRAYQNAFQKQRYKNKAARGECVKCKKRATSGVLCDFHRQESRLAAKRNTVEIKLEVLTRYGKDGQLLCCWPQCDIRDPDMLSIDHINDDGYLERKRGNGNSGRPFYLKLKKQNYPSGYQTLCHNHQWKKELMRRSGSQVGLAN